MAFVQEWTATPVWNATSPQQVTGPATTAGNDLILRVFIRGSVTVVVTSVTDDAGNIWGQVGAIEDASADMFLWHAANADPTTTVTVNYADAATPTVPLSANTHLDLAEFSDVGPLISVDSVTIPSAVGTSGFPTPVAPTSAGQLLFAMGGTQNHQRTWASIGEAITPTDLTITQDSTTQLTNAGAYAYTASDPTPVAIGWEHTGGSASAFNIINALFDVPGTPPDPPTDTGRYLLTASGWVPATTTLL